MNENEVINEEVPAVELTAGEILRNARTTGRRKREITTISKQLCISEEFLTALEEGNYNAIPETVYILGFARNYAMELGLNPDEIVAKIKAEMGLSPECGAADVVDAPERVKSGVCNMPAASNMKARIRMFFVNYWKWILGGLAVFVILLGSIIAAFSGGDGDAQVVVDAMPVVVDAGPKYSVTIRERFGTDNAEDAIVVIQATAESWVKVEDARGNTEFSRVLVPGDIYYVPAKGKYKATFGNAGGVDIWVNGKLAPAVGEDHVRKAGISLAPDDLIPPVKVADTPKEDEKK